MDAYDGSVRVIVTGTDEFSNMFYDLYKDTGSVSRSVPDWLGKQITYPEEMFIWRAAKFNTYHVTDANSFIQAEKFYEIPKDGSTDVLPYFYTATPAGFSQPEFLGVQPLQLHNSPSKNLAGYLVVQNQPEALGQLTFYSFDNSNETIIGPVAAREVLGKDKQFQAEKPLFQGNLRLGKEVLYRIGGIDLYFIPVFSSGSSAANSPQLVAVAAVGASSYPDKQLVGIGDNASQAFANFLVSGSKLHLTQPPPANNTSADNSTQGRIAKLETIFANENVTVAKPTTVYAPAEFLEKQISYESESEYGSAANSVVDFVHQFVHGGRVYEWQKDAATVNFGVISQAQGVPEIHYISVKVG